MDTFTTTKPPRLSIETKAGTVTIETVDGSETTVEITPLNDHDATLDALLATTVDQHGDDIVVHVPGRFSVSAARRSWPSRSPRRTRPGCR
jgi:hypothetical protein